jgi:hypothetical protein
LNNLDVHWSHQRFLKEDPGLGQWARLKEGWMEGKRWGVHTAWGEEWGLPGKQIRLRGN